MSTFRSMKNEFEGFDFYNSTFNLETGTLAREVEVPGNERYKHETLIDVIARGKYSTPNDFKKQASIDQRWHSQFGQRVHAFSPSPETIDISITDWCDFGC